MTVPMLALLILVGGFAVDALVLTTLAAVVRRTIRRRRAS